MVNQLDVMELLGSNSAYQIELKSLSGAFENGKSNLQSKQLYRERMRCYITIPSIVLLKRVLDRSIRTSCRSVA